MDKRTKKVKKKKPLKIALISFISIMLVVIAASSIYANKILNRITDGEDTTPIVPVTDNTDNIDDEEKPKGVRNPKPDHILNVLMIGVEDGTRSDSLILFSINSQTKQIDLVSIPRDTYYQRPKYNRPDQRKINAAYGIAGDSSQKARSTAQAVSNILGTTIDYYIRLDFDAVVKIVNKIGGVPMYVPVDMPDGPVFVPQGSQLLMGEQALAFVRFRGYPSGDLGRVKAQQDFIKAVAKKALSLKNILPVVEATSNYVRTNMTPAEIRRQVMAAPTYKLDSMQNHTIPGQAQTKDGLSYFIHDEAETYKLIENIYNQN